MLTKYHMTCKHTTNNNHLLRNPSHPQSYRTARLYPRPTGRGFTRKLVSIKSQQQTDDSSISSNGKSDITEKIDRQVFLDAKGQVAGYDILNENCANQTCDVELSVRVYQYKSPGLPNDSRRRIAVLPFTGGKEFRKMVTRHLQEQLVQSRRFAVLDREHEWHFTKSLLIPLTFKCQHTVSCSESVGKPTHLHQGTGG